MRRGLMVPVIAAAWLATSMAPASAQVLIWSLPKEDGAWVRFEGTYKQTRSRPNSNAGDEALQWRSELTISAVGSETAELDSGKKQACRWIEFKSLTKPDGLDQELGPGDLFVYKVLIPEERVIGKPVDNDSIPVTFLPIVKGWRKIGQRDAEAIREKALAVYPTIALVTYYPDLKADAEPSEPLEIAGKEAPVRLFKGKRVFQNASSRSTNVGELWLSDAVPFGLARFHVTLAREEKPSSAPADEFARAVFAEVDMSVVATGNDARSEIGDKP